MESGRTTEPASNFGKIMVAVAGLGGELAVHYWPLVGFVFVGASLLAKRCFIQYQGWLIHRIREQAPSHRGLFQFDEFDIDPSEHPR